MIPLLLSLLFILYCAWLAAITDGRERIEFILDAAFFDKYDVLYTQTIEPTTKEPIYFMMTGSPKIDVDGTNYPAYYKVIPIKNNRLSRWWAKFVIFCNY